MNPNISFYLPLEQDIYDWNGDQLHPDIRKQLTVNHIVRIQVIYPEQLGEAVYVQITKVMDDDLEGVVLDTYRQFFEGEIIYLENGEVLRFPRACVIEVPIDWNESLKPLAQYTGLARSITGML